MTITIKDGLMVAGYNFEIFRNKKYSGLIGNVNQAAKKVEEVKNKYPMYFEKGPDFGPSKWQDCEKGLPKDNEGFVQVFIKNSWDKARYQKTLGSDHPKCFATEENVVKFYLRENTDYFNRAIDAAKRMKDSEGQVIAQLSLGRSYEAAEKRIVALQNRVSLSYKAIAAVAIIVLMVFAITNRYAH